MARICLRSEVRPGSEPGAANDHPSYQAQMP